MNFIRSYLSSSRQRTGFLLLCFTCIVSTLILWISLFRQDVELSWLNLTFYALASVGISFIFATLLYLILYLPFALLFKKPTIPSFLYIIGAILLQSVLVIDSLVFSLYGYHLSLDLVKFFLEAGTDVFVFDPWMLVKSVLLLTIVVVLPYILFYTYYAKKGGAISIKKQVCLAILLSICFGTSCLIYIHQKKKKQTSVEFAARVIPEYPAKILTKIIIKMEWSQMDTIDQVMFDVSRHPMDKYPLEPLKTIDSIPEYNIVYLVLDSWSTRAFDSIVTPNIYHFSKEADVFTEHFSSSNATIGSIFGMFYGLPYIYETQAVAGKVYPVFFDRLKQLNYDIEIFSSANLVLENSVFGALDNISKQTEGENAFERDNRITEKMLDFLEKRNPKRPFYSLVFYDLAHAISIPEPYRHRFEPSWSDPDYLKLNNDTDPLPFFNLYRNCIYYVDGLIGKILDKLKEQGLDKNTIIVVTGDHAQEFNETKRNFWGHFSNYSDWQIKIPMLVYLPDKEQHEIISHVTTHYDLVPTLMGRYMGVLNNCDDYSVGYDLYDNSNRYPFWSGDFHIRTSLVFEDVVATVEHANTVFTVTDRQLKPLPRDTVQNRTHEFLKAHELTVKFSK